MISWSFSLSNDSGFDKNIIIYSVDMCSSWHIDNKEKDILILGKSPRQRLDDITLSAEKEYAINFSE